ncbi:MAG: 16S rRNA (guanine(527)-N(7))-methyltransferase RsmG [Bryobacteraceae bacterium]|nr:16S rRNA (guanine(527)-N(7))-methyltransferase RsmG [Bryobacteraceae bacterium]
MSFSAELSALLPSDLPQRDRCIQLCAQHLDRIVEANRTMNLTRILGEREAAIKHVVDSVMPWQLFKNAKRVADAGTGAGFPGIPLAVVLPETQFFLLESVGKKARFVQSAVAALELPNVAVLPLRAEEWLQKQRVDLITLRAVAPIEKAIPLLANALKGGTRALLYKGPDVENEIEQAREVARQRRVQVRIVERYTLPDGQGSRTIVQLAASAAQ